MVPPSPRPSPSPRSNTTSVPPLVGEGMVTRRLVIRAPDVVFLKGVVEAHDGLAQVFGERGGDLILASPADREAELDAFVRDLAVELNGVLES